MSAFGTLLLPQGLLDQKVLIARDSDCDVLHCKRVPKVVGQDLGSDHCAPKEEEGGDQKFRFHLGIATAKEGTNFIEYPLVIGHSPPKTWTRLAPRSLHSQKPTYSGAPKCLVETLLCL